METLVLIVIIGLAVLMIAGIIVAEELKTDSRYIEVKDKIIPHE